MTTLSQYYAQKRKNGTSTTTKKTFMVPVEEIYLEEGANIRPVDQDHAEYMRDCWIDGSDLPPLSVIVTERGVMVIDGQHRFVGAKLAIDMGHSIPRIECKDFVGTELDKLAHMAKSSQGKPITPLQRAGAYNRAKRHGHTTAEIAKAFGRSVADVEAHLQLLSSGDVLIGMVESGEVAATTAVALVREHGMQAGRVAKTQLEKAKATGKTKLTRAAAIPLFSAARARRLVELLAEANNFPHRDASALELSQQIEFEVLAILEEYRSTISIGASQPTTCTESGFAESMLPTPNSNAVWPAEVNQLCSQLLIGKELSSEMIQKVKVEINRNLLEKVLTEDIKHIVSELVVSMEAQG